MLSRYLDFDGRFFFVFFVASGLGLGFWALGLRDA